MDRANVPRLVASQIGVRVSETPLRILLLLRDLNVGGAQRQATILARALAALGHEITIATLYPGGALETDLQGAPVRRESLDKQGRADVAQFGARYLGLLKRARPDVIYSFLTVQNLLSLAGRLTSPRPLIVWGLRAAAMDMDHYDELSRQTHAWEAHLANAADLIIANSEAGAADAIARGFPAGRVRVVTNAVDTARFAPDPEKRARARATWDVGDDLVIGHAARLDPMKDHDTFLAAFALVFAARKDVRAVCILPTEQERAALKGRIEQQHFEGVLVTDDCSDIATAMNGFDLFCSSSAYGEGFSNTLAEALACGKPCVATNVGDAAALVGDAGMIAPPRSPHQLAAALLQVMTDASALRSKALARGNARSPETVAHATETVIREAMARRA